MLLAISSYSSSYAITGEDLIDASCTLNSNETLKKNFKNTVEKTLNTSGKVCFLAGWFLANYFSEYIGYNWPFGFFGLQDSFSCFDDCDSDNVTWCMYIWHPTEKIEVCLNRTWKYSSPAAEELGLIDNLKYIDSCQFWPPPFPPLPSCIQIAAVKSYYEGAYFTCTAQTNDCSSEQLFLYGVDCKYFNLDHEF